MRKNIFISAQRIVAPSVNIPGAKTWAGNNIKNSETELIVPSIVVKGIPSKEVFESIELQGFYEIKNPIVVFPDGTQKQITGSFKIIKRGQ